MVQRILKTKSRSHRNDNTLADNHLKNLGEKILSEHLLCFARFGLKKRVIHPNASSRTHWILNIHSMSAHLSQCQIRLNTFKWGFGLLDHAKVHAIMEHIPKINHAYLRLIIGFPPICDDVKWPSPDLPTRPPFALPPDAPAAVAMVQTRMPKMVVKGDKGLQVKPCS